jgi:hypothetical protein
MDSQQGYYAKLEKKANRSKSVLRVLKRYQKLGEETFSEDLHKLLQFDINFFIDRKIREMLIQVILSIRRDIMQYKERRDQVNGAIREMESHPKLQVNAFARNMYVKTLGGNYWVDNYEEDINYVLDQLSSPDVNDV